MDAQPELKILLIEDSALLRGRLRSLLDVPGLMRVTGEADSEPGAISEFDRDGFDILIVDVELKSGSGIGVIRHVRDASRHSSMPLIVVLTNFALPTVRRKCLEAGADYFLDKVREFQELKPLIEAWRAEPES